MVTKLLAAVLVVGAALLAAPQPANCTWCTSLRCYSQADCNAGCVCVGSGTSGSCVSAVEVRRVAK